jgi:molecular chaperone GrpE
MSSGADQTPQAPEREQGDWASDNGGAGPPAEPEPTAPAGGLDAHLGTNGDGEPQAEDLGSPSGPPPAPEADLGSLLVEVERQRDEYLDALRRLQAEFDNYRKRVERHQRDVADNASAALVTKLLPALDTADLALAHGGGEDVKQVAAALFDVLSKEGLQRIDPEGEAFDPEHHDAIAHEPAEPAASGEEEGPLVSEVMRAGYRWRGRVIRPAMVKVRG